MAKKIDNNENEKQNGGDHKKKESDGSSMVVLKIDLHCEGCTRKIIKSVLSLDGVESVRREDNELKKITVISKVNPVKLCENVEQKLKKKVELISPLANKQNDGKNSNKDDAKTVAVKDESKPKKIPVTVTVLKMPLHCQGCIDKIRKIIRKTEGFMEMSIDKSKDLVIVKGGMDVNMLITKLKNKIKIKVEVVPVKDSSNDGGKKGKGRGDGAGEGKKGKGSGDGAGEGKESGGEVQRLEGHQNFVNQNQYMYPYPHYIYEPRYPFDYNMHASQMFNDENPNACSIM